MTYQLREYQLEIIQKLEKSLSRTVCIQLPTGCGKSVIAQHEIKKFVLQGKKVLVLVPNCTLVDNLYRYMTEFATSVYSGVKPNLSKPVMISTYASAKKYRDIFRPDLVVIDECHHTPTDTILNIVDNYPRCVVYGFTATVNRSDGIGLDKVFSELIVSKPISWFINKGYLADYSVYIPEKDKITFEMIMSSGEDIMKQLEMIPLTKDTFNLWKDIVHLPIRGKTIIFNFNIAHSKLVNHYFLRQGITSIHIDGSFDPQLRKKLLQQYNDGKIQVLNNVNCLSEGVDVVGIDCVILNGFTKSQIMFMQRIGRGLRPAPGKKLIVIDSGKNFLYHGDIKHKKIWSLETKTKSKKKRKAGHYYCSFCGSDLGTTSDFWPELLQKHPEFDEYRTKKVCCNNLTCDSHGDEFVFNVLTYTKPEKKPSDVIKIDPRLQKYSKLDLEMAELNALLRRRLQKDTKAQMIVELTIPKEMKKDALAIVYEKENNRELKIKALLGSNN